MSAPSRASVSPIQARSELAKRRLAKRRLLEFCPYVRPGYQKTAAHSLIAEKLEQVERYVASGGREGLGRLMIFMPPRHGKTELASKLFPAWFLGRNPDKRIIMTSYGAELASDNSRAVRNLIMTNRYAAVFGALSSEELAVELSADSRSVSAWDLKAPHRGGMVSAGVGGGITGRGAHLLNIDDPFKGREEAMSESYRKRTATWFRSVAYPRLEEGGAVVLFHTRWDQEDLAGELLKMMVSEELGDVWEVVFLPALALDEDQYPKTEEEFRENLLRGIYVPREGDMLGRSPGQALWPEKYPAERLRQIEANILDFEFTAQYQQMPRLAIGNFFDDRDFKIIERAPEGLQWFRYVDLAIGNTKDSDFNCSYAIAFTPDGDLVIRDPYKERNLDTFLPQCRRMMLSDEEEGVIWGFEDVAFQVLVVKQMLADKALVRVRIMAVKPEGSKEDRAYAWRLRAKQGKVKLVKGAWNMDFIRIAAAFPNGRHDDDVDSVSGGVQMQAEEAGGDQKTASDEAVAVEAEALFG